MSVWRNAIFITFKRVRVDNCNSIYNMRMVEKINAPEKWEKEKQVKYFDILMANLFDIQYVP